MQKESANAKGYMYYNVLSAYIESLTIASEFQLTKCGD